MDYVIVAMQIATTIAILNVWLIRRGKASPWRGGDAGTMKEEFVVYGLPEWSMPAIGILKIFLALLLMTGVWLPFLTKPAALGLAVLMFGAVTMHFRANDALKKSLPAFSILVICLTIAMY